MKTIIGIDYSMSCPAITAYTNTEKEWNPANCHYHYLTTKKKYIINTASFHGQELPEFTDDIKRWEYLADQTIEIIQNYQQPVIFMEGFSFGSKGMIFNIAGNTWILRYKLWKLGYNVETPAPTTIKKFATGKGNAKKKQMVASFIEDTRMDLHQIFVCPSTPNDPPSPLSDIADSYFVAKYGFSH